MQLATLSKNQKAELVQLLQEKEKRSHNGRYKRIFAGLYGWQKDFIAKTKDFTEVCLCAANRIGKTYTGTYIDAIHLLGEYPADWPGHKFSHAPLIWCLGYSGEKTRDLLQRELFGTKTDSGFTGGLVPADRIVSFESMTGTPGAMRTVRVRHKSGGTSIVQFWSYSQGQHALMGDSVDFFHIDEEPKDQAIHPQVITRTATGDKGRGGRGILTFTPENGRTELVIKFMDSPGKGQFFMQKGWDDAPHLSEDVKEKLLDSFPAHQREMRTRGVPMLGHGRIYDFGEDFITCEPFEIPRHFRVIDGMDFGWDHPQARVRLVFDPENDDYYITHAWKQSHALPSDAWGATQKWAKSAPTAWPHDGLNSEKSSGEQQKKAYVDAGFTLLPEMARWPDGGNGVEAGIFEIRDLISKGKFKVFNGLRAVLDEMLQYHRDDKGKIVKTQDDALDAMRYAYMMRRYAKPLGDILTGNGPNRTHRPRPRQSMGRR